MCFGLFCTENSTIRMPASQFYYAAYYRGNADVVLALRVGKGKRKEHMATL
uniref:Uncharacterized protein n=1 Tax=Anguilla anguilla TaxID=7936 RepID=A0A0E9WM10_ANGAN